MPKTKGSWRKVPVDIHNDPRFRELSMPAGYLLFHIHTHPQMSSMGCMRHCPEGLAGELRGKAPFDVILAAFEELVAAGYLVADVDASFVGLPHFFVWAPVSSPNLVKGWGDLLEYVPRCETQAAYFRSVVDHVAALGASYADVLPEAFLLAADSVPAGAADTEPDGASDSGPVGVSVSSDGPVDGLSNAVSDSVLGDPDTESVTFRDPKSETSAGSNDPGGGPPEVSKRRNLTPQQAAAGAIGAVFQEEVGEEPSKFGPLMGLLKRYRGAKLPPLPDGVDDPDPPVWHLCRDLRALDLASAADPESFALKCLGNALRNGKAGRVRGPKTRRRTDAGRNPETEKKAAVFDQVFAEEEP
ncbi:MAG: hypothetical protein AAGN66_08705 [Acidobacteriota bacterium]